MCHPGVLLLPRHGPAWVFSLLASSVQSPLSLKLLPGGGSRQTLGLTQEWKEAARVRDAAPWSRQDLQSCLDIRMSMQVQGVPKDAGCSPAPAILGGFNPGGRRLGKEAIPPDEGKACSKQDGVCFMLA